MPDDIFVAEIRCPHCGEKFLAEFHAKLHDSMMVFNVGDPVFFEDSEIQIIEGKIKAVTMHYECKKAEIASVVADIVIKDGKFAGVENVRKFG